jgi:hypothetical protein
MKPDIRIVSYAQAEEEDFVEWLAKTPEERLDTLQPPSRVSLNMSLWRNSISPLRGLALQNLNKAGSHGHNFEELLYLRELVYDLNHEDRKRFQHVVNIVKLEDLN